jgi:predicted amidohydrolase YtcJ
MSIDSLLINARIATMDSKRSSAEAFAVANGRIVAIGSTADIRVLAGPQTRIVDAEGRVVTPGFIDTHAHMDREGLRQWYPSLSACRSIADVQAVVAGCAADRPGGEWIVTGSLGEPPFHMNLPGVLRENRYPDRHDLDRVAPDHPVWIRSIWGLWSNEPPFVHVLNSAALAACGIDRTTPAPNSHVTIERDEHGEPTGRIMDSSIWPVAEFTILRATPRWTPEIREAALERSMALSLAAGTTGVYEGHGVAAELHQVYKRVHDRGAQTVRATFPISPPPWNTVREATAMLEDWAHYANGPGFGDDRLRVSGVYLEYKAEPDVCQIANRVWPYTGWAGFLSHSAIPEDYVELCRVAARLRMRVATAIAMNIDDVLTIWERIAAEFPIADLRWTLVHGAGMVPARDYPRIKRLGAVITTQPSSYLHRSGLSHVARGTDPDRLMAHRDYIDHELPWALSTDNKPYGLIFTLWTAVNRIERTKGEVVGPSQRVTVMEALYALTAAGAYTCFTDADAGSLEVGKFADAIAFSDDPFTIEPEKLKDLRIDLTLANGEVMHDTRSSAEVV